MIDQFGDILNTHLKQTVPTKYSDNNKYPYKFLEDYFQSKPKLNTFDFDKLTLQVTNDYLKSNHIIFENFNSSSKIMTQVMRCCTIDYLSRMCYWHHLKQRIKSFYIKNN